MCEQQVSLKSKTLCNDGDEACLVGCVTWVPEKAVLI